MTLPLTRRIKAAGDHYIVAERKGQSIFLKGSWTSGETVERIRAELKAERSTGDFATKKKAADRRRVKAQTKYVEHFQGPALAFLDFHPNHF